MCICRIGKEKNWQHSNIFHKKIPISVFPPCNLQLFQKEGIWTGREWKGLLFIIMFEGQRGSIGDDALWVPAVPEAALPGRHAKEDVGHVGLSFIAGLGSGVTTNSSAILHKKAVVVKLQIMIKAHFLYLSACLPLCFRFPCLPQLLFLRVTWHRLPVFHLSCNLSHILC